ncbi:MAG: polysaccharide biosynthesis tyrosine autokinase [Candidatus Hydrogenedentes bacterium]|nr:polysaccharide biosynthesis tyrosine autokinase [Candidatus Hydrogenedentota bacterium]
MASETAALAQAASQSTRENQLRFMMTVAQRRWPLILLFTVLVGAVYGVWGLSKFKTVATYSASTKLNVRQSMWEKGILRDVGGKALFLNSPAALVERISKEAVAEAVVQAMVQQGVAEGLPYGAITTEKELAAVASDVQMRLRLEPDDSHGTIVVSAMAATQDEANRLTEFAARAFIGLNRQFLVEEEQNTLDFVVKQLDELRQELDKADSELWHYRKDMGFRTKDQVTDEMQKLSREISNAETTKDEIHFKMQNIEQQLREQNQKLPLSIGQISDEVVVKLINELSELHQKRISMSVVFEPGFQPLQDLQEEIREKEQAILIAMQELDGATEGGVSVFEDRQQLRDQYVKLQIELTSLDIASATNQRLVSELEAALPSLAEKDKEYQDLVRKTGKMRDQLDALLDKEFEISTAINREGGFVERQYAVVSSQVPTSQRVRPWMNFVIGGFVGLIAGFGFAMLGEYMDTTIRTIEDVADYIGVEVIGAIPKMRFGKARGRHRGDFVSITDEGQVDACIVTRHDPKSPISEAYRTLRTNFQLATIQTRPRSLMITSAVPGEGKTTTAVNLAVTLADSGLRILIIDTDLRRPHVHHVLRMERGPGLADVLREGQDVHRVIRPTRVDNLWMISSGRVPPNPSELIGSDRMRRVMEQLTGEFDLVICDAPSVLVVTDPVLLATEVDTAILVVSVKFAARQTILRGKRLLETARAHLSGVVLNGLEATGRHYYYYYYYYDEASPRRRKRWYHF